MNTTVSAENSVQVLTGDFLKRSGITRLTDILTFAEEWTISGTSGMKYQANAGGLDLSPDANWLVLIDHQRIFLQQMVIQQGKYDRNCYA